MRKSFLTEQELAWGCVHSDRDAQGELYARYSSRLYAICLRYIEDREEARDLMHDCMIKAMDNFKSFRYVSDGSLYAWLSRITVNMAINRLKESSRFRQIPFEQVSGDDLENALEPDAECIDGYSHHDIARALGITERTSTSVLAKARASLKKALMNYIDKTGL